MRMAFTLVVIATIGCYVIPGTPEAAFHEFQTTQHKESYLALPLCTAGEKVVPLVIEKVIEKELERRRYAIGFLGTVEGNSPVPVLERIAKDDSESEYIRGDALESLFVLDKEKGKALAADFNERTDFLGAVANEVMLVTDHGQYKLGYQRSWCEPSD